MNFIMSTQMQVFQTVLLTLGIAVSGTACGLEIKNLFDTKKEMEAINQNGERIAALAQQAAQDHRNIMERVNGGTEAILAQDQQIIKILKTKTPPKGSKVVAPKDVNVNQQDNENVQNADEQEDPRIDVVVDGFNKMLDQYIKTQQRIDEMEGQKQSEFQTLCQHRDAAVRDMAVKVVKGICTLDSQQQ